MEQPRRFGCRRARGRACRSPARPFVRIGQMPQLSKEQDLRVLPSVDEVLKAPAVSVLLDQFPHNLVVAGVREVLAELREGLAGKRAEEARRRLERLGDEVAERVRGFARLSLRQVINATGVILHTNLGRAPLGAAALEAICETAGCYGNLEYDL